MMPRAALRTTTNAASSLRARLLGHLRVALGACAWVGLVGAAGCSSSHDTTPSGCDGGVCSPGDSGSPRRESGADAAPDVQRDSTGDAAPDVVQRDSTGDAPSASLVPAFYVSPSGNDTNAGTLANPFLTLGRAQSAMQGSMSIKTTYLRAGTYDVTASSGTSSCYGGKGSSAIDLGPADDGETWSYYPPDGFASAAIDGGSTSATTGVACAFAANDASNLTFIGLQFQHLQYSAIYANSSPSLLATDNTISDLTVAVFNVGGVALHSSPSATVKNNYIHDVAYMGVGAWGGGMSDTTISGNVVLNSCMAAAQPGGNDQDGGDCGAIYTWDETHASTNILVSNNYVRDVNISSNGEGDYGGCCATGIYVDDGMSNVTVSGNVVTGIKSQCFVIHGGNDNTYTDNLCDLDDSEYQRVMTYQWDSLMLPMTGNSVVNNIIVASSTSGGTGYADDGTPTMPLVATRLLTGSARGSELHAGAELVH